MDVIALTKAGIKNVVAIMGTSLTIENSAKLKNMTVNLFLDADDAGKKATAKSLNTLIKLNISAYIIQNEYDLDPDEILSLKGVATLKEILNTKISSYEFIFQRLKANVNPKDINEIENFIQKFSQALKSAKHTVKDYYSNLIFNEFNISKEVF
jgi:DNA primase